jgi:hypothetical protein
VCGGLTVACSFINVEDQFTWAFVLFTVLTLIVIDGFYWMNLLDCSLGLVFYLALMDWPLFCG